MTRSGVVSTLVWAVLATLAIVIVARAHYTTDLSAFLPRAPTATQKLLVDQLRDGLASRLIIVAVEGSSSPSPGRCLKEYRGTAAGSWGVRVCQQWRDRRE